MFFICSLPRSRSAWIANYLTFGDCFCGHDLLKDCQHSVDELDGLLPCVRYRGIADPGAALAQDKLIEAFPLAKWIIIERPFIEVERAVKNLGVDAAPLHMVQSKLEELRAKIDPVVIEFDCLNASIKNIAHYIDPQWRFNKERHDMLVRMNVQVDLEIGLKEIKNVKLMKDFAEPVTMTKANREYLDAVKELCNDKDAYSWFESLIDAAVMWDHIKDRDGLSPVLVESVMYRLTHEWPINPFIRKYGAYVVPTIAAATSAWKYSYTNNAPKELAYLLYSEIPAAIAFILGGTERVIKFMPRIRELVQQMCNDDMKRDGGRY
jgi:hypothetical protein